MVLYSSLLYQQGAVILCFSMTALPMSNAPMVHQVLPGNTIPGSPNQDAYSAQDSQKAIQGPGCIYIGVLCRHLLVNFCWDPGDHSST